MSAKAIHEYDGKILLSHWLPKLAAPADNPLPQSSTNGTHTNGAAEASALPYLAAPRLARLEFDAAILGTEPGVTPTAEQEAQFARHVEGVLQQAERDYPFLSEAGSKWVAKPDQLIKRRGKAGLLGINLDWADAKKWVAERAGRKVNVGKVSGTLHTFIVEPFVPHPGSDEYYVCVQSVRDGDEILFTHEGGVDVGDVDAKAQRILVKVDQEFASAETIKSVLLKDVPTEKHPALVDFLTRLYAVYSDLQFTYLEINPLVVSLPSAGAAPQVSFLDLAAKIDQTADFEAGKRWSAALLALYPRSAAGPALLGGPKLGFPAPFGRELTKEEQYIADLDAKTGASLKLTVLNARGRVWTMVAGGGASVVYSDAIANAGFADELANYGEYSGAPSEAQTYEYAKTILDLMTRGKPHPEGKVLLIGGGIANFTNVASTFKGIIRALNDYKLKLQDHGVKIFVRRAGPNYQEGLRMMRNCGDNLGVPVQVYGPEMHVSGIVPLALLGEKKAREMGLFDELDLTAGRARSVDALGQEAPPVPRQPTPGLPGEDPIVKFPVGMTPLKKADPPASTGKPTFTNATRSFVYGMQPKAVQGMLDFDYMCKREVPSVAAMVYPFGGSHVQKFYWGTKETLLPVFTSLEEAISRYPDVDSVVNFASFRSVYESTRDIMKVPQIKNIAIIAEGVPEKRARQLLWQAKQKGVLIIGPATVGGIKPGCFKIGNTGGMMDNIVSSLLYRPGSVAYVSKSGGMSNELNNIISRTTNGVAEGVAIGGDRYPGSTFIDHLVRYEKDPSVQILLLLGEVGGVEEYDVAKAIKEKKITKPVVAWCIGTCGSMFKTEVQFGHAGSFANSDLETAAAKNAALKAAGAYVPNTFEDLPKVLTDLYRKLVQAGTIVPKAEPDPPKIPIDYSWAQELGLVRKPTSFISTITDDRGQELLYAGMPISDVFKEDLGIGGVLSLLWFKRRLPDYACQFIEMILMLTADHGPAVSGALNTIVTARAGKDLISSLVAGLLTIGPRFGGALDDAAKEFAAAYDSNWTPADFVENMRKEHKLIPGIGHRIKSRTNPDLRVSIVKDFVKKTFPNYNLLSYALEVEKITTSKKDNLILNVDGAVGVAFVDLLRGCGAFSPEEADEYMKIGTLNGLFVLGRSIGFVGHYLDQKRLKQGLYRHPWDDISYLSPEQEALLANVGASQSAASRTFVEAKNVVKTGTQRGTAI
ncbi:citrate synthase [Gonapodya prolifera JEL478]|uniref:ATP citrate synthase n=1 Tax=Gonapodya prolifera (strain JEL478) TaxID=1344416 RepID=A0A139AI94_GONPJ|nr:citrate synthase [Gonapodya prolifera JEL478]|eukprot:KXS16143.1 citrate synthase [Gonapodya prolifera JEL478]